MVLFLLIVHSYANKQNSTESCCGFTRDEDRKPDGAGRRGSWLTFGCEVITILEALAVSTHMRTLSLSSTGRGGGQVRAT